MPTIHTSRKLEKLIKKYIVPDAKGDDTKLLDSFYAEVITIHRKRCWIVIHEPTAYCVILANMVGGRIANAGEVLAEAYRRQWEYEGIESPLNDPSAKIQQEGLLYKPSSIQLAPTNGNRRIGGLLRDRLENVKNRMHHYPAFIDFNFEHEAGIMNRIPFKPKGETRMRYVSGYKLMHQHLGLPPGKHSSMMSPFPGEVAG